MSGQSDQSGRLPPPTPGIGGGPLSPSGMMPPTSTPTGSVHGDDSPPRRGASPAPPGSSQSSNTLGLSAGSHAPPLPPRQSAHPPRVRVLKDMTEPDEPIVLRHFSDEVAWEIGCAIRSHFIAEYPDHAQPGGPGLIIQVVLMNGLVAFQTVVGDATSVGPSNM